MKFLFALLIVGLVSSCTEEEATTKKTEENTKEEKLDIPVDKNDLIKIEGDVYTEYYEDGKTIKFKGTQDAEKKRHGKWVYLSRDGVELSMYMYDHGKRHGHCIVKHPNGAIYYYGEWENDKKVGIWKMYDETGKMTSEKNYDDGTDISAPKSSRSTDQEDRPTK